MTSKNKLIEQFGGCDRANFWALLPEVERDSYLDEVSKFCNLSISDSDAESYIRHDGDNYDEPLTIERSRQILNLSQENGEVFLKQFFENKRSY
jgi:hypothetical protein